MAFAAKYGPWALVAGASDGLGAAFARELAERGVNVVLLARRQALLDQVAAEIKSETSAQTRTVAIDLAKPDASVKVAEATADLEIGFLVYCAGADPNYQPFLVAYGASKAFDMVFAEALWAELHDRGVDVLGLILSKTDTPALRRLEHSRGQISSPDEVPAGAGAVDEVVAEAFENLTKGPTLMVGEIMRAAEQLMGSLTRNQTVELFTQAAAAAMGPPG
ncbi:hypothetical protein MSIMFB_00152 [Mycobacterium simulans]|uniref:Short-chain dehydrogenase n=1 Tax=Mycobacterium simulans TaxID=627089 RepID=A0A7Z7IHR0_9MYCO|nr:SDR family NAD(P)-dependent oxidoreductase [Mycobacterium simulans]SOJ52639.1 hypothetical protein MSIMFB_00152 [Mycobacterium simulans]